MQQFDGLNLGHLKIMLKLNQKEAKLHDHNKILILFEQHPFEYFFIGHIILCDKFFIKRD